MKILAGVFNPIAYDGRVQRAAEALAGIGEVTVVCPAGPAISPSVPIGIAAVQLPDRGLIRDYGAFVRAFIRVASRYRPDVIHGHDYYMALPGVIASRLTGARFVYDAHELIIPERGRRRKAVLRFFGAMERIAIPRADLVIAANAERAERMAEYFGMARPPLVVGNIPAPPPEATPDGGGFRVRAEGWRPGDRVLVYQGHLKLQRGLSRLLDAFAHLPEEVRLIVVGSGPDAARLREEVRSRGLSDQVRLLGRVSRTALPGILRQCDVGVLSYSYDTLNDRLCAPNKVFEYAQAGLPVLATDQAPLRRFVEQYGIGRLIAEADGPERIAATIRAMACGEKSDFAEALARFLADHSWEEEAGKLRREIELLHPGGSGGSRGGG